MSQIIIYVFLAFLVGQIGKRQKFGFWGYFIASLVFTPLGGLLLLIPSEPSPKNDLEQ